MGPAGAVLAPSAPILSFVKALPPTGLAPSSVTAFVSDAAMGASSAIAILRNFAGPEAVLLFCPSIIDTWKLSVTATADAGGVTKV